MGKRWGFIGFMLVLLGAGWGAYDVPVAHGQDSIQIQSNDALIDYPVSVHFALQATSSEAPITSARIYWRTSQESVFRTTTLTNQFRPANAVAIDWTLGTQFLQLPPFAQITYRWQVRDQNGNEAVTEDIVIEYEDTRHDWQELANERIRLLWYGLDESFAEELFEIADAAYLRLADYFGVTLESLPLVLIYPDQRDFAEFQRFLLNVESVVGRYFPGHNLTVNLVTPEMERDLYEVTIAHELSHLYSDNYYTGAGQLPLWLEEGLAQYNETIEQRETLIRVRLAAAQGRLVPFIELPTGIRHRSTEIAVLSYAEGATIFQFMVERWGAEAMSEFLDRFRRTTDVNAVMTDLFGLSMAEFEMAWRAWLGFPVDSVPELIPVPTVDFFNIPTPTPFPTPG